MSRLRLYVIACKVFEQELAVLAAGAKTEARIQYLEIGLHTGPAEQHRVALQSAIDAVATGRFDAIALAYGLCNRGIVGLQARTLPVVIPRAHDCIGMLLGSSQRYLAELESHPGTYFQSPGWVEHLPADHMLRQQNLPVGPGLKMTREDLVARYGEENAAYLLEQLTGFTRHYCRLAYISTPVPQAENHERAAAEIARQQGWTFDRLPGDLGWLRRLLDGDWTEQEFLKLKPGERLGLRYDSQLIAAEPP
ncbi:MAG: DUF1638 domain-containing protein [Verrucomicrobiia bacterium]